MPENPAPPPPVLPAPNESQARTWNMLCHLSTLAGYVIPFGNFIGPILVWQLKKNEIPSVVPHAKAALNFQITVFIALLVTGALTVLLCFMTVPIVIVIALCGVILPIIAGIKANDGQEYRYPCTIEILK